MKKFILFACCVLSFPLCAQNPAPDYYFASANATNRYFFDRSSLRERPEIGAQTKQFQTLWVLLSPSAQLPTLSYVEMTMVADCSNAGKVGLLKVSGYTAEGVQIQNEEISPKDFEWTVTTEQNSWSVNWNAACTNIVWPSTAHFPHLDSKSMASKARQKNVLPVSVDR